MNTMKSIFAVALLSGAIYAGVGCDTSEEAAGAGAGKSYPPVGSHVDVQFRRDYLGLASDKPTTPMGEGMGIGLGSSGELKKFTDEFLVLQVDNEPNRELWIPRAAILLLDVKRKQ